MKKINTAIVLLLLFIATDLFAQAGSGIYVGGHFRRNRPTTVTTLRESGFTYVILFNVNVDENGNLSVDYGGEAGGMICSGGKYVFDKVQPHYAEDVKLLLTQPTSVERVEICIGGWGNNSYKNIKSLIDSQGTDENSMMYKNFKALREAIPEITAVNNDDEACYDVKSAVEFHTMMYDLGYKTTLAPYMYKTYWSSLVTSLNYNRPGACDRVMIQCYDGGAGNNPASWQLGSVTLHAGRTNYQTDMETSIAQMQAWKDNTTVTGGFVWVYNDESWNLHNWATSMNRVFKPVKPHAIDIVATVYSDKNYGGYAIDLPEGSFCKAQLAARGLKTRDVESIKVKEGYQVTLYSGDNFTSSSKVVTENLEDIQDALRFGNRTTSIRIEPIGESISKVTGDNHPTAYYDASMDNLEIDGAAGQTLSIYTTAGEMVGRHAIVSDNQTVNLSHLPKGIYVAKTASCVKKIVKN